MKKFATLTIGQAPRPDLAPVFNAIAPAGTEVVHAGCLDGLTKAEVDEQFAPVGTCKSSKDHSKPRNEVDTSLKSPV